MFELKHNCDLIEIPQFLAKEMEDVTEKFPKVFR